MTLFYVLLVISFIATFSCAIDRFKRRKRTTKDKINEAKYKQLLEWNIKLLNGIAFEHFCAFLFQENGYRVQVTPPSRDGGKDIILKKKGEKIYVECKAYAEHNIISRPVIQKLVGACAGDNIKTGYIITTSGFTKDAIDYIYKCKTINVVHLDMNDIIRMAKNIGFAKALSFFDIN